MNYNRSSNYPCSARASYGSRQTACGSNMSQPTASGRSYSCNSTSQSMDAGHSCGCNSMSQSMDSGRSCGCNSTSPAMDAGRSCADGMTMQHTHNRYDKEPLAMAYVPWQHFGELYPPCKALSEGTAFPDLNQIFCGVRG